MPFQPRYIVSMEPLLPRKKRGADELRHAIFMLANAVTMYFHPQNHTLMDIKLGTRVMKPGEYPEHLKTWDRKVL